MSSIKVIFYNNSKDKNKLGYTSILTILYYNFQLVIIQWAIIVQSTILNFLLSFLFFLSF